MKNKTLLLKPRKGGHEMAINDTIEIISNSNPDIYGKVGVIKEIREGQDGIDLRVEIKGDSEFWIDADDVVIY